LAAAPVASIYGIVQGTNQPASANLRRARREDAVEGDVMTQTSNRLLDEFAKLMTDAASVAQGIRREVETAVKSQAERFLSDMDVVQREEFEAVRDMAVRAREENEALRRRIEQLEAELRGGADATPGRSEGPAKRGARKRTGGGPETGLDPTL
jgi:BMFP domain-containing protein YqiC